VRPATGSRLGRQPGLGLMGGLLFVVPLTAPLAFRVGGAEGSVLVLGPLTTFALPVVALIAFWWEDWPGTRLRSGWAGWADTALVIIGAVVLTMAGQAVTAGWDPAGIFDPGAASQVRGGVIWGIGAALREESLVDPRYGGFLNSTMEEYAIPVNADIHRIDVDFVDRSDPLLNPVGVKGLGEVAMVGVSAAVGNAVFHATGTRFR
jgi:hypothetical protein